MSGSGTISFLSIILLLFCAKNSLQAVYTHSHALKLVNDAGIFVTSRGQCSIRRNPQCTSLDGIHSEAIDGIITLKRESGCPMVITGGTEAGHSSVGRRSHGNGWKIDIRKRGEDCITNYIKQNFKKISANRWRVSSGNIIYTAEDNHWDIQFGNYARDKRRAEVAIDSAEVAELRAEYNFWKNYNATRHPDDRCFRCICQVESGCRQLGSQWDMDSLSCGYFQIKKAYYEDCGMPGHREGQTVEVAWKNCAADYDCSTRCIQNYAERFGSRCHDDEPCQKVARTHNGGPNGCISRATNPYWNSVSNCLNP